MTQRAEKILTIVNSKGLHVRAATLLAQTAAQFDAIVTIEHAGERANGKSIMNLLLLTASQGTRVQITTEGNDAEEAMAAVAELVERGFYDDNAGD